MGIKINTTRRHYFTLTKLAIIKNRRKITSVSKDVTKLELSYIASGKGKQCGCCRNHLEFFQ